MPYVAAWETNRSGIWYEFVSERFLHLFQSTPGDLVDTFRASIISHRQYHHTDIYPDIQELTLSKTDLEHHRIQLREQTVKEGAVEVIYKVAPPNHPQVWLKDWATVTIYKEDGICLSPGFLCDVSLEMNQKDHIDTINTTVNRDKDVLLEVERVEAFGQLSAKVFHEIRNPILSIGALATRLLKDKKEKPSNSYIKVIAKEAARLEHILNHLFHYTRKVKTTLQPTNLADLTKQALILLQSKLDQQNIHVRLQLDEQLQTVMADQEQLHLALVHLIKNSIDAMTHGGTIFISIKTTYNSVILSVRDGGDGIAREHVNRLVEPFFTTKVYGTGLGLSLAQKVVDIHKGTLNFYHPETGGTEVTIELPLSH